ncbi:zinc finger protein 271-like [Myzus persicae]|uniref:zinc finger protein 271-like n=1 Tax=Myzus persicae TaxID=13164 RepID=UPI000B934D5D|nr:zinc finger protein 271-like [Myzus persicae]
MICMHGCARRSFYNLHILSDFFSKEFIMEPIPTIANDCEMNSEGPYIRIITIKQEYIYTTVQKDSLESHHPEFMRSLTLDKRSNFKYYKCGFCEKTFSYLSSCVIHTRIHTGEKPYMCGICYKKFSHHSNCVTHIRIHTGEKPYNCNICKQNFSHSSNLKAHKRKHTGEKPFLCYICGKEYSSSGYLKKHTFRHTEERI